MPQKQKTRPVIITTERRGVFYGQLKSYDEKARVAVLVGAVMAIQWGTTDGLFQLCSSGPTSSSKLSSKIPGEARLELCECVLDVSAKAEDAWQRATANR